MLNKYLYKQNETLYVGAWRTIVCGGVGGISLWVAIFPFDVIKSRMQISNTTMPMMKMLFHIARTEGTLSYLTCPFKFQRIDVISKNVI